MTLVANKETLTYNSTNNADNPYPSSADANIKGRSERSWKLTNTGTSNEEITLTLSAADFIANGGANTNNTYLLISDSPDFSSNNTAVKATNVTSSFIYFRKININDITGAVATGSNKTKYLTIGLAQDENMGVLPVELTSFTAKTNGNSVSLAWTTASEKNASHFNITRSVDSRNFTVIGEVKAAGNTNEKQNYRFTDFAPLKGNNYYQLQQVDIDGTENPSDIVSAKITLNNSDLIVKQVNDRTATLNIVVTKASNGTIHVTNALGQKIAQKPVKLSEGLNTVTVSTGNSTNLLIFTLVTPEGILSKKIAK